MSQSDPPSPRSLLLSSIQSIISTSQSPSSRLPPSTLKLIESWSNTFIETFGLAPQEEHTMEPLLSNPQAVEKINDLLIEFYECIRDHESIMDETDPTSLDLLYDPSKLLAYFRQMFANNNTSASLSLGRILGRHAKIYGVETLGRRSREGGWNYRF